jgi:hypothetical protein
VGISYRRFGTIYRSHPQAGFKSYRRFGTTYRSHPQEWFKILEPCLKMGSIDCSETSVRNYHYSLRNNPEERSSQLLRAGSLISRTSGRVQMSRTRKKWSWPTLKHYSRFWIYWVKQYNLWRVTRRTAPSTHTTDWSTYCHCTATILKKYFY